MYFGAVTKKVSTDSTERGDHQYDPAKPKLNKYGDPVGTMYPGGVPGFYEKQIAAQRARLSVSVSKSRQFTDPVNLPVIMNRPGVRKSARKREPKKTAAEYRAFLKKLGWHNDHISATVNKYMKIQKSTGEGIRLISTPGTYAAQLPYCGTLPKGERKKNYNCITRPSTDSEALKKFAGSAIAAVGAAALISTVQATMGAKAATAAAASAEAGAAAPAVAAGEVSAGAAVGASAASAPAIVAGAPTAAAGAAGTSLAVAGSAAPALAVEAGALTTGVTAAGVAKAAGASALISGAASAIAKEKPKALETANALLNSAATIKAIKNGQLPPPPIDLTDASLDNYAGIVAQHMLRDKGIKLDAVQQRQLEDQIRRDHGILVNATSPQAAPNPIKAIMESDDLPLYIGIGAVGMIALIAVATRGK